jgi:myosin heavy subunit
MFVYIIICSSQYAYQDCKKYKLGDARSFHYLNQSNCIALDAMDDSKEYMETRRAMGIVGIGSDEQVKLRFCQL